MHTIVCHWYRIGMTNYCMHLLYPLFNHSNYNKDNTIQGLIQLCRNQLMELYYFLQSLHSNL